MSIYYQDEHVTLIKGDAREVTAWRDGDVMVTDPPYGIGYRSGQAVRAITYGTVYGGRYDGSIDQDEDTTTRDEVLALWAPRPALVFGSLRAPFPRDWRTALVWDKGLASGMGNLRIPWRPNWEPVFVVGDWPEREHYRGTSVIRSEVVSRIAMGRLHPHEKPVDLLAALIASCPMGVVVDPFAGAGSTLLAAKKLGRRAVGVELTEHYCRVAASRLAQGVLALEEG